MRPHWEFMRFLIALAAAAITITRNCSDKQFREKRFELNNRNKFTGSCSKRERCEFSRINRSSPREEFFRFFIKPWIVYRCCCLLWNHSFGLRIALSFRKVTRNGGVLSLLCRRAPAFSERFSVIWSPCSLKNRMKIYMKGKRFRRAFPPTERWTFSRFSVPRAN